MTDTVPCYICGTPFPRYTKNSKYCSQACRQRIVPDAEKPNVECAQCKTPFQPKRVNGKYCTTACLREFRKLQARKPGCLPEKPCKVCQCEFKPTNGSQVYCSLDCKNVGRKETVRRHKTSEKGKKTTSEYNRRYWRENRTKDELKDRNLRATYGISLDDYFKMSAEQGHACKICRQPPPDVRPLCVEHCHATGKVRGLCCIKCNNILGNAGDSIAILQAAIDYLKFHETPQP